MRELGIYIVATLTFLLGIVNFTEADNEDWILFYRSLFVKLPQKSRGESNRYAAKVLMVMGGSSFVVGVFLNRYVAPMQPWEILVINLGQIVQALVFVYLLTEIYLLWNYRRDGSKREKRVLVQSEEVEEY